VTCNCSAFIVSIQKVISTWTFSAKASINPTMVQLIKIVYSKTLTFEQKMAQILIQLNNIDVTVRVQFKAIIIYKLGPTKQPDTTKPWGSVGDFGNCASAM